MNLTAVTEAVRQAGKYTISYNWHEQTATNAHTQTNIKSELQGADDGFCAMGAFSELYVNTGFPALYSRSPAIHNM